MVELFACDIHKSAIAATPPGASKAEVAAVLGDRWAGAVCVKCRHRPRRAATLAPQRSLRPVAPQLERTAAIVTCHDYARYLPKCLDSILAQTLKPAGIIVVDDSSTDSTGDLARLYESRGVRYLRGEWRDVAQARNAGAAALPRAAFQLHVDADNWLPPNYLQTLTAGMDPPPCGATYAHIDRFDDAERPLARNPWIRPFDHWQLRRGNFADTCSLIRTQALEQVGGWRSLTWGLQDWDLWLRITGAGWTMKLVDGTALCYRKHSGAMSEHHNRSRMEVVKGALLTTIVTLFSGREWMLARWFAALAALDWPRESLHVVAVDNSRNLEFASRLKAYLESSGIGYTYVRDDRRVVDSIASDEFTDTAAHRIRHAREMGVHMARLYCAAARHLPAATDLVLSIEDDVEFPPHALMRLAESMYAHDAGAVGGLMRNRFFERSLLARIGKDSVTRPPPRPTAVTTTGFYCLLLRRDVFSTLAWRAGIDPLVDRPFYDWSACHDMTAAGRPVLITGDVLCRHWQKDGTCVDV